MRITLLLAVAGCGGAPSAAPARTCEGDRVIVRQADVAEVAACGELHGSLTIRGAAVADLSALASLETVRGDLVIGPTFDLDVVSVEGVRRIGGALRVVSNGLATGVFLPRLEHAGSVEVAGNVAIAGVSMPALRSIDGDLVVEDNPSLERLDTGALESVGGATRIQSLDTVQDRSPHW